MSNIRVRIAPSPTGNMHIGTARTAIFNYLFAKRFKGAFILRIEDTDIERSDKKFEKNIFESLDWLEVKPDESPLKGGSFGPYRQSERLDSYKKYIEQLLDIGRAFYCFHSEEELEKERKELMSQKLPPVHWCEFRNLSVKEAEELAKAKKSSIIRFKTPAGEKIKFNDEIRESIEFSSDTIGDFSLAKNLNTPLYNFAVVIDDAEMKISHCIRGEDHIPNTPKQIMIFNALGINPPIYAHLPLIFGQDRSKLSKRHGAQSVTEYRDQGFISEALFNFLALLGWNGGGEKEIYKKEELISLFDLRGVQKSPAVFDLNKLEWMNGEYMRALPDEELTDLSLPFLQEFKTAEKELLKKIISLEKIRIKKLSDLKELVSFFFEDPKIDPNLLVWKNMSKDEIIESLKKSIDLLNKNSNKNFKEIENIFMKTASEEGDKGKILWPLRVALTGKKASPGPFEVLSIIGNETALRRLKIAIDSLK